MTTDLRLTQLHLDIMDEIDKMREEHHCAIGERVAAKLRMSKSYIWLRMQELRDAGHINWSNGIPGSLHTARWLAHRSQPAPAGATTVDDSSVADDESGPVTLTRPALLHLASQHDKPSAVWVTVDQMTQEDIVALNSQHPDRELTSGEKAIGKSLDLAKGRHTAAKNRALAAIAKQAQPTTAS